MNNKQVGGVLSNGNTHGPIKVRLEESQETGDGGIAGRGRPSSTMRSMRTAC